MNNMLILMFNTIYTYIQLVLLYILEQAPKVNRKTWIKSEKLERKIASKLGNATVINGVVYSSNPKRIGKNQIAVLKAFWKIIYNDKKTIRNIFIMKMT